MLVLERVPVKQYPPKLLAVGQALVLPLNPGNTVSFGRSPGCAVRTEGPGLQATLAVDAASGALALTKHGSDPAPGAKTTKLAPHGLRVVTPYLGGTHGTLVALATHQTVALRAGDTIVFTLHAASRTCFAVREACPEEQASHAAAAAADAASNLVKVKVGAEAPATAAAPMGSANASASEAAAVEPRGKRRRA